jgi:hypothetical protein
VTDMRARTRLRHDGDGMIVDLWTPANAIVFGQTLAALGRMGFYMHAEDNQPDAVFHPSPPQEQT